MPVQCPDCGRFLSKDLVTGLAEGPTPCPTCGTSLTAEMFSEDPAPVDTPDTTTPAPPPPLPEDASVRPPDLAAETVRTTDDGGRDPLAGWDEREGVVDMAHWRREHRGLDPEAVGVIAAGAGALGAGVGAALAPRRRGRGALLGALLGVLAALIGGQVSRRR